jgi:hypothetical protein
MIPGAEWMGEVPNGPEDGGRHAVGHDGVQRLGKKALQQVGRESCTPAVDNGGGGTEDVGAELAVRTVFRPARGEPAVAHGGTIGGTNVGE